MNLTGCIAGKQHGEQLQLYVSNVDTLGNPRIPSERSYPATYFIVRNGFFHLFADHYFDDGSSLPRHILPGNREHGKAQENAAILEIIMFAFLRIDATCKRRTG